MAKFIFSLGEENFRVLASEAKTRDITIQELIRAVIIPDWMRHNMNGQPSRDRSSILSHANAMLGQRSDVLPPSIGRLKT